MTGLENEPTSSGESGSHRDSANTVGKTALQEIILSSGRIFTIDNIEHAVLVQKSQGVENATEIVDALAKNKPPIETDEATVSQATEDLLTKFDVPNLEATISLAISEQVISIDQREQFRYFPQHEKMILRAIAQGMSDQQISMEVGKGPKTLGENLQRLQLILQAKNRLHLVRRSYEAGVFPLPSREEIPDQPAG